jgi:hypothetical protein
MKVLVMSGKETKVMEMEDVIRIYRVTEKQVLHAIRTGHLLKTMYFDFFE